MCSSSPWKPPSGSYADCDGDILKSTDNCCPVGETKECDVNPNAICNRHPQFGKLTLSHLLLNVFTYHLLQKVSYVQAVIPIPAIRVPCVRNLHLNPLVAVLVTVMARD